MNLLSQISYPLQRERETEREGVREREKIGFRLQRERRQVVGRCLD